MQGCSTLFWQTNFEGSQKIQNMYFFKQYKTCQRMPEHGEIKQNSRQKYIDKIRQNYINKSRQKQTEIDKNVQKLTKVDNSSQSGQTCQKLSDNGKIKQKSRRQ